MNITKILPLVSQLGSYLKMAADHYADLRSAGRDAGPDILTAYLLIKMADWHPRVGNKELLDEPTRQAAARFLAGVAINLTGV